MLIEVAYALPTKQKILALDVPDKTTIQQAIELSDIVKIFPEIDISINKTGIFGKKYPLDTVLREKDRVEIYRELIANPKEVLKTHRKIKK